MRLNMIVVMFFLFPVSAMAEWSVENILDKATGQKVMSATYSDKNHQILINRKNNAVWMYINRKQAGSFERNGVVEIRVDNNRSKFIEPLSEDPFMELTGPVYQWQPSTVGFRLWHGNEDVDCGYFVELLAGKELKARYPLDTRKMGGFRVTLEHAKAAIIKGLGLSVCGH